MRSLTRLCCALAVALPLGLSAFQSRGAAATAFTVNSLGDTPDAVLTDGLCADASGACTLRAAIQQANADAAAASVGFAVNGAINLTGALPDLSTNMTIGGPGSSLLTVRRDTGGIYRVFTVGVATVTISGLTISNGQAIDGPGLLSGWPGEPGGGVSNKGTLTLTDCVVSGNASGRGGIGLSNPARTRGINGSGGGVYNEGRLTMNNCVVSNNSVQGEATRQSGEGGGGIYSTGELSMTGCTVSNNRAGGSSSGLGVGAGIYARGRTRITNSVVRDNRGGGYGGGVYNSGNMTAEGTTFSGNSTADGEPRDLGDTVGSNGGGIANFSVMTLTHCTVSGNWTGKGGVALDSGGWGGSGGDGGGIWNNGTMEMRDSTVSNNVAGDGAGTPPGMVGTAGRGGGGGGIFSHGVLTVTNCVVSGNVTGRGGKGDGLTASRGDGGDGGGISHEYPSHLLKLSHSTVAFNEAGAAGDAAARDGRGGGLYGGASLRSTIVASNFVHSLASGSDVSGQEFVSSSYNGIGIDTGGCCFNDTDRRGSGANPLSFRLDLLTLIPLPGSPAIDAGLARGLDDQMVTADRRGAARPFDDPTVPPQAGGDDSDIGAFERQSSDPAPPPAQVGFNLFTSQVIEGCVQTEVTVERAGPQEGTTVATYAVTGSTASQRGDFTYATGRVTFAPGEDTKTIPVLISEDAYAEGPEELTVALTSVTGGSLGSLNRIKVLIEDDDAADGAANPIDDDATFVGQHYHDFLSRQADDAGQAFWTSQLAECAGDPACLERRREDVSAAFFLSTEFQATGYFAIRVNKAAFGDRPDNPRYLPFLDETQELGRGVVVGEPGSGALLEANKQRYTEEFVTRAEFQAAHGGQNAGQYVDSLFAGAGATPTQGERDEAVSAFGIGDIAGRASSLRSVVESGSVYNKLYNPAFVLMQYFAYLRRNPDAAPDNNFDGYNFWLAKLDQFTAPGEDVRDERVALSRVRRAEMVRAFLLSAEYRGRFQGTPNRGS
ncbi:MAG: Calx-beta domain-containing protein [Pyrinomonadaceae bacterium]